MWVYYLTISILGHFRHYFVCQETLLINYLRLYKEIRFLKPSLLDGSKSNVGLSLVSSYIGVGTLDLECELQSTLVGGRHSFPLHCLCCTSSPSALEIVHQMAGAW